MVVDNRILCLTIILTALQNYFKSDILSELEPGTNLTSEYTKE